MAELSKDTRRKFNGFCRSNLNEYEHKEEVKQDLLTVRETFPSLRLYRAVDESDGEKHGYVYLDGTLPITYKDRQYHIPLEMRLHHRHPRSAPICRLKPSGNMVVSESSHVDKDGTIRTPYLVAWSQESSDLIGLLTVLQVAFSRQCPIFASRSQSKPAPAAAASSPPADQAQSRSSAVSPTAQAGANTARSPATRDDLQPTAGGAPSTTPGLEPPPGGTSKLEGSFETPQAGSDGAASIPKIERGSKPAGGEEALSGRKVSLSQQPLVNLGGAAAAVSPPGELIGTVKVATTTAARQQQPAGRRADPHQAAVADRSMAEPIEKLLAHGETLRSFPASKNGGQPEPIEKLLAHGETLRSFPASKEGGQPEPNEKRLAHGETLTSFPASKQGRQSATTSLHLPKRQGKEQVKAGAPASGPDAKLIVLGKTGFKSPENELPQPDWNSRASSSSTRSGAAHGSMHSSPATAADSPATPGADLQKQIQGPKSVTVLDIMEDQCGKDEDRVTLQACQVIAEPTTETIDTSSAAGGRKRQRNKVHVADHTGGIYVLWWGSDRAIMTKLRKGSIIRLNNCQVRCTSGVRHVGLDHLSSISTEVVAPVLVTSLTEASSPPPPLASLQTHALNNDGSSSSKAAGTTSTSLVGALSSLDISQGFVALRGHLQSAKLARNRLCMECRKPTVAFRGAFVKCSDCNLIQRESAALQTSQLTLWIKPEVANTGGRSSGFATVQKVTTCSDDIIMQLAGGDDIIAGSEDDLVTSILMRNDTVGVVVLESTGFVQRFLP